MPGRSATRPDNCKFGRVAWFDNELARATVVLRGPGRHRAEPREGPLYRPLSREPLQPFELTLIPYYAWANRGKSAMSVWLPVVLGP